MYKNYSIIGGGYTGLVAALRLAKLGHRVTIFEKEKELGGLAADFKIEGSHLEKAYHHIFKTDKDIIELSNELGIYNQIEWNDSSVSIYYDKKIFPFNGALDLIKFTPIPLLDRIRLGIITLYLKKKTKYQDFEKISALRWMKKISGTAATEVIWEPLLKGKFDKYFDKVSMAWLWARIHVRANSRGPDGEKLGYFKNGFQTLTNELKESLLKLNVVIKTNTKIISLVEHSNSGVILNTNDGAFEFDACLATVPSHVLGYLIDKNKFSDYIETLKLIKYIGARIIVFSSTQNLGSYYWNNINDSAVPFLVFINHTNLIDKKNYNNKFVYYIASYLPHNNINFTRADEELEIVWFNSLKSIFKEFDQNKISEKYFFKFENAQHVVDENYRNKIPEYATPIKNLYLSNFSQIYPEDRGTNYAVREGNKIAKLMLTACQL